MSVYRKAIILGFGDSGEFAARLLLSENTSVTVVDRADTDQLRQKRARLGEAEVILGCNELSVEGFDVCIVSPGIPSSSNWVKSAEARIPVISELELGASRCNCQMIGVTGSNGKSTMVKLCNDALQMAGLKSEVAGNYGKPVCEVAFEHRSLDWLVLEVSSFQLEKVEFFAPRLRVLLNIQPDHLDRHGTMEEYRNLKMRLFRDMNSEDIGIVPESEMQALSGNVQRHGNWLSFGVSENADYRYLAGKIVWSAQGQAVEVDIAGSYFDNSILGLSAAASVAVLANCGVPCNIIQEAIRTFVPLPHRMEEIACVEGVRFVDDSKATNLTAMIAGIEMSRRSVRLIAGGQLKEKTSPNVKEVLVKCVKSIYLIGEASKELYEAWSDTVDCQVCFDLRDAVLRAKEDASAGDVVLLSPGCASFDQFQSYKDRGNQFKEILTKEI